MPRRKNIAAQEKTGGFQVFKKKKGKRRKKKERNFKMSNSARFFGE